LRRPRGEKTSKEDKKRQTNREWHTVACALQPGSVPTCKGRQLL